MRGLAHQAVVLSVSRIANYGLMIISPIILVRFLSVRDFGHYREFLLYASLLQSAAAFAISDSLLYFIPLYQASMWRVVRETTILTALISASVVLIFLAADLLVPGGLVGPFLVPVVIYVLLFVNLDWWESFWVVTRRPMAVVAYTGTRLMARMVVVVCVAIVTRDVVSIIWALIALEGLRLAGSFVAWRVADRSNVEPPVRNIRREQLRFCVPFGLATLLALFSRNLGNVVIVKYLGAAALAQLTIGTYGDPIILALRNSITTVVLPELVRLGGRSQGDALRLWHRTVVINCLLLFPAAAVVIWYAEPIVLKLFGVAYKPAVPVLQWYALVFVRSCFDFSPLLRAINKTRPFMTSGIVSALVNGLMLIILLPRIGVVGAVIALVVANFTDAIYLGVSVTSLYRCGLRALLPWSAVAKITACALGGAAIAFGVMFPARATLVGAVCGTILYGAVFAVLLLAARVDEAAMLLRRLRTLAPARWGR